MRKKKTIKEIQQMAVAMSSPQLGQQIHWKLQLTNAWFTDHCNIYLVSIGFEIRLFFWHWAENLLCWK